MEGRDAGRRMAERHGAAAGTADPDPIGTLLNYAERPHEDDWTLRSALVRLAQPEPARVGALLQVMRRLDAPLHHVARQLERHTVVADRSLTPGALGDGPVSPYPDARVADLARLTEAGLAVDEVVAGYQERQPLEVEELRSIPLLGVALRLETLADRLTAWAGVGPADPPIEDVDTAVAEVERRLDDLGVPVETGPPPGAGRGRSRG